MNAVQSASLKWAYEWASNLQYYILTKEFGKLTKHLGDSTEINWITWPKYLRILINEIFG